MRLQAAVCILLQLMFESSSCEHLQVTRGSTLELPCLSIQTEFLASSITWQFNGKNISDSIAKVKNNGLFLSISPVTIANQGQYVCMVKDTNMEMIRTYEVTVAALIGYIIKSTKGSTIRVPCVFPTSRLVEANAIWFREDGFRRTRLNVGDGFAGASEKIEQLYPMDHDQTILIRNADMEDAGTYSCESADGERLSSVTVIVEVPPTPVPYSCSRYSAALEACQDKNSRTAQAVLQESMVEFSMKLYSSLRSQPSSNMLFSPISINMILYQLLLGARGDTKTAIERALSVPHDFHCVHFEMSKLREKLASPLQMASQIYHHPQIKLWESFTNDSIQYYEAAPTKLLETSEENTQLINSWVANKTNNKIQHLIDSVSPSTQLILINAVSFSGQWMVEFEQKPKKGSFSKLNGDLVRVPIIYHQKYMLAQAYVVELMAQVARFPLTGNSSLYILLPPSNTVEDLQQVEGKMTDAAVLRMIEQMKTVSPQRVEVTLPQIALDLQPDMHILLKRLGLSSLFEDANLCGLSPERLVLDDAKHRAFLKLTERGVEAGAVTSMSFSRSFFSFNALRPFIMLLWSDQANVPLFIGRVTDP